VKSGNTISDNRIARSASALTTQGDQARAGIIGGTKHRDIFPIDSGLLPKQEIVLQRRAISVSRTRIRSFSSIAIASPKGYGTIAVERIVIDLSGSCVHGGTIRCASMRTGS
jgi:hypothetical protein